MKLGKMKIFLLVLMALTANAFADEMKLRPNLYGSEAPGGPSFLHALPTHDFRALIYSQESNSIGLLLTFAIPVWQGDRIGKAVSCTAAIIESQTPLEVGYILGYRVWENVAVKNETQLDVMDCVNALNKIQDGHAKVIYDKASTGLIKSVTDQ